MGYILIGTIIGGIIWGIVVNKVIENKGYEENWFWWGFFFGIFALIIALTKQSVNTTKVVIESSAPVKENMELLSSCILNEQVNISSPVHIASWEIKKDADKLVLFVDFINVSRKDISAVMFSATGFNAFGDVVQVNDADFFDVIGQDLSIKPNECGKVYIVLQDNAIRKIEVKVKKVCFVDGTIVDDIQEEWINTNQLELKSIHIDCARRENAQSKYHAIIKEGYWQCVCGFVNSQNTCAFCNMQKNIALRFTQENIEDTYNSYLIELETEKQNEKERQIAIEKQKEEERIEKEHKASLRAKRNKKIIIITTPIILLIIGFIVLLNNVIIPNSKYNRALNYIEQKNYKESLTLLESIDEYKGSKELIVECKYQIALNLLDDGKELKAMEYLQSIYDYKESKKHIKECVDKYASTISNECFSSYKLDRDGTVKYIGGYVTDDMSQIHKWKDIVQLMSSRLYTVGVKKDQTIVIHSGNDNTNSHIKVSDWNGIKTVSPSEHHLVGLKNDGTVVMSEIPEYFSMAEDCDCNIKDWTDIISISAYGNWISGLKKDGTVVVTGKKIDTSSWNNIVEISAGENHLAGLKSDGTVVFASTNGNEISNGEDIVSIVSAEQYTLGLKFDGTVCVLYGNDGAYNNTFGECNVDAWENIIAVSTSGWATIGLKADGTYVATGNNEYGQCDVQNWSIFE